ncbi:MAG: hypothetical protein DRP81_06205 [Candidatus Omnitrophota bacterium]|nr:MAG: hypothetical protein DRP81_06205 [Candidatus Omnitrophota bacterium]
MNQYNFSNVSWDLWELVLKLVHPYIKAPKIGRNQPCPCGSGRKYKLCCLGKKKHFLDRIDFNRCFLDNGELAFQPPQIGSYSRREIKEITKHILKIERMSRKIARLSDEEIEQLSLDRLSDCELLVIAECYLESDKKDKVMELFARVAESDEVDSCIDYFEIFEELINYWRDKDIDKAIYFMQHRMRKIPCSEEDDPDMDERDLADLYIAKGDKERGIKIFEKLINRNPDNIWNYNGAALSLQEGGEYQLAEKYIREGIKLARRTKDPEDLLPQLKDMLKEVKQRQKK